MKILKLISRLFPKSYTRSVFLPLVLFSSVLSSVTALLVPVFIGKAIDSVFLKNGMEFILKLIFIASAAAASALFQWIAIYCGSHLTVKITRDLRVRLFDSLCYAPLGEIEKIKDGDIVNIACNDIDLISDGLLSALTQLFFAVTTVIGTLVFMLSVKPEIAAAVALLTPLSIIIAGLIAGKSYRYFKQQTLSQGRLSATAAEILSKPDLIKSFNYSGEAKKRFNYENNILLGCGFKSQFWSAMTNPSTRFVNSLIYAAAGIFGCVAAVGGTVSLGEVSALLIYAGQYTKPFNEISGIISQFQSALASAERVFNIIDMPKEDLTLGEKYNETKAPEIEFKNVSFSYPNGKQVLKNFNTIIKSGDRAAVTGKTGCGKTTLCSLLLRFYDSYEGDILIEGQNIKLLSKESLRSVFGVVMQDIWLFTGTIRENLQYANPSATDEDIKKAVEICKSSGFISRLENGFDTIVGTETPLSFGQRQLLCIVRAMLSNPSALILDEATSGIDVRTEKQVADAFFSLMRGKTSIIVAHRPATAANADIIIDMQQN